MKIKVLSRTMIGDNKWLVKYEYWNACYCTKKTASIEIEAERRPTIKDVRLALS